MAESIPLRDLSNSSFHSASSLPRQRVMGPEGMLQSTRSTLRPSPIASGVSAYSAQDTAEATEAARVLAANVRQAQEGNAGAMDLLIENNRPWVRGIAYTVLGDPHLAEDAAQEVCVRILKHLRGLDTPEAFRPWLYRMTRNVALSMAQRRERAPQPLSLEAEQLQDGCKVTRYEQPGASLDADERVGGILETIGRLPEIYREVLVLKHIQELSYTEMSALLGVSVKSLEVRLVRARKLLQDRLGRHFHRGRKRDPRSERE